MLTDPEQIDSYNKRQATIKTLREVYCYRLDHAKEVTSEIKVKDDVNEALEWLKFHKEKDSIAAAKLKEQKDAGEEVDIQEEDPDPDDPEIQVYRCEPPPLRGF